MRRGSFTLVELLITIGIVALLAGLLIPAAGRARETARRAGCLSNLKQIGAGLELYGQANRFCLPTCCGSQDPAAGPTIREVLLPNLSGSEDLFRCPSDAEYAERRGGSYDWNTLANGQKMDEKTLRILDFSMPVMGDYDNFHGSTGERDAKNWLYLPAEIQKRLKK